MPQPLAQNLGEQLQDIYNGVLLDAIDDALASQKQELIKRFLEKLEPVIFEWCESWSAGGIDASNRETCKADLRSKLQELKESKQ